MVGGRSSAMIVEAGSHEELDGLLKSIPWWPIAKVEVTPLQSFETRAESDRGDIEHLEAAPPSDYAAPSSG